MPSRLIFMVGFIMIIKGDNTIFSIISWFIWMNERNLLNILTWMSQCPKKWGLFKFMSKACDSCANIQLCLKNVQSHTESKKLFYLK